jgi:hypothetical protein
MAFAEEYEDEESWAHASRRKRTGMIAFVTVAVLTLVVGIGAVLWAFTGGGGSKTTPAAAAASSESSAPSPADSGTIEPTDAPSAEPSPAASPTPSPTKKTKPKVKTQPPPKGEPVAPPPPKPSPGCVPKHFGTDAPKADVRKALDATAHRPYYQSKPQLVIPATLLYAVAWQESGWQSTIKACDGGIGTMQVMPGTVEFLNTYVFGENLDPMTLSGNTQLGGQYLAYLTKFFGDQLVPQTYDLMAADKTLLNAVVSAYNVGPGAVTLANGWDGIPNKQYVNNVRALMDNCPCSAF